MSELKRFLCLSFVLGFCGIIVSADVEFPPVQAFGAFVLVEPLGVEAKTWRWHITLDHSNINMTNDDEVATVNMEWTALGLIGRYGLGQALSVEGALRIDAASNGFLDRIIEGFHSGLGLPEGGREKSPRNLLQYQYKKLFDIEGQGAGPFFSSHLAVLWRLTDPGPFSLSLRLGLTLHPQARVAYKVAGILPFAGLTAHYAFNNGFVALSGHWRSLKKPDWLAGEALDDSLLLINFSAAYKIWRLGLSFKNSPFPDGRISQGARQIYVGCGLKGGLEFGLYQELFYYTTLPDVGFRLGFSW